ncbi:Putative ribonuclease H protein At1g65750 [Linum grandiflorum]
MDLHHQSVIKGIRELINHDWTVKVTHTYREGNRVADLLDHRGHNLPFGTHSIDDFPLDISECIRTDMIGVSFPRSIIINH